MASNKLLTIFCRHCGRPFISNGPEYCSPECAQNATGKSYQSEKEWHT